MNMQKEEIASTAKTSYEKAQTRQLSIKEGSLSAVSMSFGSAYITPFALALKANNLQIGFLSSFLGLLTPLFQLLGLRYMETTPRKKIIVRAVLLQSLMWLPIIFLAYLSWKKFIPSLLPWALLALFAVLSIFGAVAVPAWFSLMGDSVEEKHRGEYFSRRNRTIGIFALFATIITAFFLDYFKTRGLLLLGFGIFFFIAGLLRFSAVPFFKKHYDSGIKAAPADYFSFKDFIKKLPKTNFGRFVIFASSMYFAVMLASPFFTVHLLNELEFSYTTFMLVSLTSTIAS
ncbi:MAG: MFS transporter, partial [Nanoarchaeota archaeon]